jgi:hypothetical protein
MRKFTIWLATSTLISVLFISSGCEPNVPARYPTIELPLMGAMSTSTVVDDIIEVPPSELWHKTIEIPPTLENGKLAGWCVASGGARNDVKVLVLNDVDFYNWRNFGKVQGLYQSEKTTVANVTAEMAIPGKYHLVISNWFSEFSSKKVIAKFYLYWAVKPVTYKIKAGDMALNSNDFQIPRGADVTFKFLDQVDTSNFQVTKDGKVTPISANITASEVKFIAPSVGIYEFSCGGTPRVAGGFSVIAAQPVIGQGLIVSSSTANAPPHLDNIDNKTYASKDSLTSFTIAGSDPDDDTLTFYAFNLPMAVSGYDNNGSRIWSPAATLDKDTGVFSWGPVSRNLTPGKYYVRFEVSDGVLSDQQDVTIEIK